MIMVQKRVYIFQNKTNIRMYEIIKTSLTPTNKNVAQKINALKKRPCYNCAVPSFAKKKKTLLFLKLWREEDLGMETDFEVCLYFILFYKLLFTADAGMEC